MPENPGGKACRLLLLPIFRVCLFRFLPSFFRKIQTCFYEKERRFSLKEQEKSGKKRENYLKITRCF